MKKEEDVSRQSSPDVRGATGSPRKPQPEGSAHTDWQPIDTAPEHQPVLTKIDDGLGVRNEQVLKRDGRLWWFPDGSMYVYYTPTHWRAREDEA